jgi:hypothetical protein
MKKIVLGLVVVASFAVVAFGSTFYSDGVAQKLVASWQGHSERDLEFQEAFFGLANGLAAKSSEVREKFVAYKHKLSVHDDVTLVNMIFLARRAADKDSLYAGLKEWNNLSEATRAKIVAHFGTTYKTIADGTIDDNQKFIDLLAQRKKDKAHVLATLPTSFQDVVAVIDESEVDAYLESLYLMMLNTVAVRENLLGEKRTPVEPKEEL